MAPISLSSALWRPTSSRASAILPLGVAHAAACRAGLPVCRLPSRKRIERPVNRPDVNVDAGPDARERTSDLGQVVHAAQPAAGAARHVASALLEPGEALFSDRHADPDAGFALLDLQVQELGTISQNALADAEADG